MNLKEARQKGKLKQFAKEHENADPHPEGKERFDALMEAMTKGLPARPVASKGARKTASAGTSPQASPANSSGTQTQPNTSARAARKSKRGSSGSNA